MKSLMFRNYPRSDRRCKNCHKKLGCLKICSPCSSKCKIAKTLSMKRKTKKLLGLPSRKLKNLKHKLKSTVKRLSMPFCPQVLLTNETVLLKFCLLQVEVSQVFFVKSCSICIRLTADSWGFELNRLTLQKTLASVKDVKRGCSMFRGLMLICI